MGDFDAAWPRDNFLLAVSAWTAGEAMIGGDVVKHMYDAPGFTIRVQPNTELQGFR